MSLRMNHIDIFNTALKTIINSSYRANTSIDGSLGLSSYRSEIDVSEMISSYINSLFGT